MSETQTVVKELKGSTKAAILLISIGAEAAGQVLKNLSEQEVETLSAEIARLKNVTGEMMGAVLLEYRDMSHTNKFTATGGLSYAREVLGKAVGDRRAEEIATRVEAATEMSGFSLLQTVEPARLTEFLQNEHPQTAALIISHLTPVKAAEILQSLSSDFQIEVMYRLGTMGKTSPEVMREIDDVIRQQIGAVMGPGTGEAGGAAAVAEIMNTVSRNAGEQLMTALQDRDSALASSVKDLMFVYDDLIQVGDRDLQRILTDVDQKQLALALKASPDELKEKILTNLSERAAATLNEEIELLGPVRVKDVEEAQRKILERARTLEQEGEITLSQATEEALI